MAADVSIGAARVHLVVDADDYDSAIGRALNSAKGFGSAAEAAFDQSSKGAKRAATNMLDYIANLGRASTEQQRFMTLLQRAAREGTDPAILQAGLKAWNKYAEGIETAAAAARELAAAQTEAARMNAEFDRQRGAEFDEATKINLARTALDQYVAGLGRAASIAPELQRAMDAGVDSEHIQQASAAIDAYTQKMRELAEAQTEANRLNVEFDRQRGAEFDEATRIDQARTAVDRYVASLGQVSRLTPELQRGLDAGVDPEHIQRAAEAVDAYTKKLRDMANIEAEAARMNAEFDRQRGAEFDEATKINQARDALDRYVASLGQANKLAPELQRAMDASVDPEHVQRAAVAVEQYTENLRKASAVESEAFQQNDAVNRQIQQLQNLQQTSGKTWYELQKLRNAQLGISKTADPLVDAIRRQNEAMGSGNLTAKQYAFAMRGLPAQITDITTSLIAGQPAYMVLLYQGGQLKDMFGGIKPAAEALGKTLLKLINPYVLTAAALGAVGLAAYEADQRLSAFAVSGIRSGGFAGTTRELRMMADAMGSIDGVSLSKADEAVQTLAASGTLAGKNLQLAAEASARWASVTGSAVSDVADKFEQIARDPLKALAKFNEAEHFLTDAQYQRIQALIEQGDTQEAVTEATRIYYDVQTQRSGEAETQITNLAAAFRDVKDTIVTASERLGDFAEGLAAIGRHSSWTDRAKMLVLAAANPSGFVGFATGAGRAAAAAREKQAEDAAAEAKRQATLTREQTEANATLQTSWDNSGTKAEKYATKLRELNNVLKNASAESLKAKQIVKNADGSFGGAGYERLVKALDTTKTKLPSGRDATQAIKDQMKAELAALTTQTQQVQAQYQLREVTASDYYAKLRQLAQDERDVTVRGDDAQIAALAGKKDAERQISTLKANSAVANEKYVQRTLELNTQEAQSTRQRTFAYNEYVKTLDEANNAIQRQMDATVARVGMGDREYEQLQARNQIYLRQAQQLREIQKLVDEYPNSADVAAEADRRRMAVMEHTTDALNRVDAGYDALLAKQQDWTQGANAAWQNWLDQVHDVAGQAKDMFSSAFDGMTNSLSDAVMGNLDSMKSYLASMQKMILDFIIKQRLASIFGGGGANNAGSIFDLFTQGFFMAKGGVLGGSGLAAYRNQIVSQPTIFPFARGGVPNVGVMGEQRGHLEAVMPLAKTPSGDLGVKVVASKETRRPVQVTQQFYLQGIADRTTREQAAKRAASETSRVLNMG